MPFQRTVTFLGKEIKREILLPGRLKLLASGAAPDFVVLNWLSVLSNDQASINTQVTRHQKGNPVLVQSETSKTFVRDKFNDENISQAGMFPGTKVIYSWSE